MENEKGYLVYKDKKGFETFDHPNLVAILSHLTAEFANYKYTVYRCALKIVALQEVLYTYHIPYKLVLSVLERHGFTSFTQTGGSTPIYPFQLTSILHDILFASEKLNHFSQFSSFNIETATEIIANFFWNIFDQQRTNPILLIEVKEIFLILCHVSSTDEMISEYFNLVADYNGCVSRYRLETLLKILTKFLSFIGEKDSYGTQNIIEVVEQCFAQCPGINGIDEYNFTSIWTTNKTRFLIYSNLLALVKRIKETRNCVHNNHCASCLSEKIVGIRFKCQVCRNVSLCMKCFSVGFENGKHLLGHRMNEEFSEDTRGRKWTHYVAKLCNIFFNVRQNVSNISDAQGIYKEKDADLVTVDSNVVENTMKDETGITKNFLGSSSLNSSEATLQTIINRLNVEIEKIEKQIRFCLNRKNDDEKVCQFLKNHKQVLSNIIVQLHCLIQNSRTLPYPVSSTPNRSNIGPLDTGSNLSGSSSSKNNVRKLEKLKSFLLPTVNGAEINKSYLEANKTDYSLSDLSTWFHPRKQTIRKNKPLAMVEECEDRGTKMDNFRELLLKVKEIVDDSYSDNFQLAEATSHLEAFLDCVIKEEENKRHHVK